jgi:hypothetical protein
MSYVFDVFERAYAAEVEPHLPQDEITMRFGILLRQLHDANHRLKDVINHDPQIVKLASALEKALEKGREIDLDDNTTEKKKIFTVFVDKMDGDRYYGTKALLTAIIGAFKNKAKEIIIKKEKR